MNGFIRASLVVLIAALGLSCAKTVSQPIYSSRQETVSQGPPRIQLVETAYDFGKISEDKTFQHTFMVKNTGSGNLAIRNIIPPG
ncbi:MAG: DUF1573 domain-containing protein [Syntrophobacteraceae bacterium]